jgi:GNAT superfamily N-acetyltransferase
MMRAAFDRKRVKGFLRAAGGKLVNADGAEVLLVGWGLGNWLLCEGYMWLAHDNRRFDRPRVIESVIRDLTGSAYSETFWKTFRDNYITRSDIARMAALGYNSVRIPINWRILMDDEPATITFREDGFALLDHCLDWCEGEGVYAFLDLHGAPGGQTGDNIDDSHDNLPRLFIDRDYWDKGIALWEELARRYRDRWIVGGYDLLNEPLRTLRYDYADVDYLLPELIQFYEEAISAIRNIDRAHLISIEGHHWATDPAVFYKKYDDNMIVHFHRYGCPPDQSAFREYLALGKTLDAPLWLGETGENSNEWYAALCNTAFELGIGINLWPWKKMECTNSPCSIKKPKNWDALLAYTAGGKKPVKAEVIAMLDEYLENIKLASCVENIAVTSAILRKAPCTLRATDFDQLPGKGRSFSGTRREPCLYGYQKDSGMAIRLEDGKDPRKETGWTRWSIYTLELGEKEFASYTFYDIEPGATLPLNCVAKEPTRFTVSCAVTGEALAFREFTLERGSEDIAIPVPACKGRWTVTISVIEGSLVLKSMALCNAEY